MLLSRFPQYYRSIPWQKTGLPISARRWRYQLEATQQTFNRCIRFLGRCVKLPTASSAKQFADYACWMRQAPATRYLDSLLLSGVLFCSNYLDQEKVQRVTKELRAGTNGHIGTVGLLLTFEIYLRQLFDRSALEELRDVA
jgi:asparagine synthase (glutamine-hydrolysing)